MGVFVTEWALNRKRSCLEEQLLFINDDMTILFPGQD